MQETSDHDHHGAPFRSASADLGLEHAAAVPFAPDLAFASTLPFAIGTKSLPEAFTDYCDANDSRLEVLERRGSVDVLSREKLDRINAKLDKQWSTIEGLSKKATFMNGRHLPGTENPLAATHRNAFSTYVRKGDATELLGIDGMPFESKSLSVGSEPDGGYLVPDARERTIMARVAAASPLRTIASQLTIAASTYRRLVSIGRAGAGWVGETGPRSGTAAPSLTELSFPAMELYAMPAATLALLDDAGVDIEAWLGDEVALAFAEQEAAAFVTGDGVNQPRGFLAVPTVPQETWSWGSLGYVTSGANGGFDETTAADALIDLVHSLRSGYRDNARFIMNRFTQAAVRKLKDDQGHYLWQPSLRAGVPATLLGYPVTECDAMPDMAPDAHAIAFGDFARGYLVIDRAGIRTLRDPFSAKPYVTFYTTKRVGGGVQDFDAIKLLRFSA